MKKILRNALLWTLVLTMALALSACGGDSKEPDAPIDTGMPEIPDKSESPSIPEAPAGPISADEAIEGVTAIGFVDVDGAKLKAIAVKYSVDLTSADVDADMFDIDMGSPRVPTNLGDGEVGDITAVYINNSPAVNETGGGSGNYVIIEVYTQYMSAAEMVFTNSLACSVKQTGTIIAGNTEITPSTKTVTNYQGSASGRRTLNADGFVIPDIENFKWYTDYPGNYGADGPSFVAQDCFDEKTGENVKVHLGYGLCLPSNWHEGGRYAMVVLDNPATEETTHPITSTLETRSPAVYASQWAQDLVKERHGLDGLIVVVPVVTARVDDNGCSPAEYEALVQLWDHLIETYGVDKNHVYGSGQSVGGMVLLETNRNRDNYFAGLMLYENQWAQNYYKDTLFIRSQASNPAEAAQAPMHYPRVKEYLTWDFYLDTDGNPVYEGHDPNNYYYLISDDNILIMNRVGNSLSNDTWRELAYLYEDTVGTTVTQHIVDTKLPLAKQDADVAAYLNENGDTGIKWVSFQSGSNGYTCRQVMAGYEWLLSQSREAEISREKLDINKPFVAAAEQIQTEDRTLHFTDTDGAPIYFITAKAGSGTQFYNTCWLNMGTVADAAPGWLPEGMSWEKGVSGTNIVGVTPITDTSGKLIAAAVEYDSDMSGIVVNLKGDNIIGFDGNVRQDISIVLDPYEFLDGEMHIAATITNIYVNFSPETVPGAARQSGSGNYVIVELEASAFPSELHVRQVTTIHTDTLIASPSYKLF